MVSTNISVKTQSGTIVYALMHNKQLVLQILGMWKHINMSARKIPGTAINTVDTINSISSVNKSLIYSLRKCSVARYQVLSHIPSINKQMFLHVKIHTLLFNPTATRNSSAANPMLLGQLNNQACGAERAQSQLSKLNFTGTFI